MMSSYVVRRTLLCQSRRNRRNVAIRKQHGTVSALLTNNTSCCIVSNSNNDHLRRLLSTAPAVNEEEEKGGDGSENDNSKNDGRVPIVWTTHRLKPEQIEKVDAIFHKVLWLDLFEMSMLTALINERLGLELTPKQEKLLERQLDGLDGGGGKSASSAKSGDDSEDTAEEDAPPKTVDLKLTGFDVKAKIKVIKEIRSIAGLGLKEAKEMVESAPKVVQKDLKPEEAEELKAKLEEIGAQIELV